MENTFEKGQEVIVVDALKSARSGELLVPEHAVVKVASVSVTGDMVFIYYAGNTHACKATRLEPKKNSIDPDKLEPKKRFVIVGAGGNDMFEYEGVTSAGLYKFKGVNGNPVSVFECDKGAFFLHEILS